MIKIFCCFYNEAALVPFFLSHYHFVATIHAFVSRSIDATRELLEADPRVVLQDVEMPDGMDDDLKVSWLNTALAVPDQAHAWHLVLDADEFVWPPDDPAATTVRGYLDAVPDTDDALAAQMANVYRVASDGDLDLTSTPVVLQRRHGVTYGVKPIVLRANRGLAFVPGNHTFRVGGVVSTTHHFDGAHWQNADPSFAVTRRIRDRKERMSPINRVKGHGVHHWSLTADEVRAELESHRHDAPQF